MEGIENLLKRLTGPLALVGLLLLLAAGGIVFVNSGHVDRLAITVAAVGLAFVVYYVLERPGEMLAALTGRNARYGANSATLALAFIGIVVLVNVLGTRYSHRIDLTRDNIYSLSPQTIQVIQSVQQPVRITAFYSSEPWLQSQREALEDILKEYQRHSTQVQYEFVDPVLKPGVARQAGIDADGTTVLEMDGKRQTIRGSSEGELTSALVKLVRPVEKKVYFLTGHGELDLQSFEQGGLGEAQRQLETDGYKVESLNLATAQKVPEDAAAVVVAAPSKPLLDQEKQALDEYLSNGGKALVLGAPRRLDAVNELAQKYGLRFQEGVAIDIGSGFFGDPRAPVIGRYESSAITRGMEGKLTIFPFAAAIEVPKEPQPGAADAPQISVLAKTTEQSWLETSEGAVQFDEGKDVRGPLPLAVSVTLNAGQGSPEGSQQTDTPKGRIVFVANADFATNAWLTQGFNRDLFLNMVSWLSEDENLIAVRAKPSGEQPLLLTAAQANLALLMSVVVLPLAVVLAGGVVWWRRR